MGNRRSRAERSLSNLNSSLVTDSVILCEQDVTVAINDPEDRATRGDVIDGLRNGLIFSAVIWAALILAWLLILR